MNKSYGFLPVTRREALEMLGALGLLAVPCAVEAANRYNIVWLMSDEHDPFVAGYAGDRRVLTPAIDSIAKAGVQFTAAYSPDPICVPSRQAFHSGRMASNIDHLTPNYEALGPYFTRMGFKTAWFGKQHWEGLVNTFQDEGVDCGKVVKQRFMDQGLPYPEESRLVEDASIAYWGTDLNQDTVCTEQALAYLDTVGSKPFFLGVSYAKPHFPFCIQQAYYDLYASRRLPRPTVTQAMLDGLSTAMKQDRVTFGFADLTPEQCDFARAIYYGMVSYMDEQVGQVLAKLDALDLRRKTIVIYVADHGEMLGQHGIWYKNAFLEASARVPMLISLPRSFGVPRGSKIDAPVSVIDLFPTLCDLCTLTPPTSLEGGSLLPLMHGIDPVSERAAFSENKRRGIAARMIRTPQFKYCYYDDGVEQLYSMAGSDRDIEGTDLAEDPDYAAIKANLKRRALKGWNPDGLFDGGG